LQQLPLVQEEGPTQCISYVLLVASISWLRWRSKWWLSPCGVC